MYRKKNTVAMLLAGGQGSRLGALTSYRAKPAVTYGGKYRIIDFTLSNCANSGIDTVGILTQYRPLELNTYVGTGLAWDLDTTTGGAYILPPFVKDGSAGQWYEGTANAIYQNLSFIEQFDPDNIIVLSGDHIYKMNYNWFLQAHIDKNADATIAVISVPIESASRFGIMKTDGDSRITEFHEKPANPNSNLASMGVYAFKRDVIRKYLEEDEANSNSSHDFGKDVIPAMLSSGARMFAYEYKGYWKDVGTIDSLWDANMELLWEQPPLNLYDDGWRIFSRNPNEPPHYIDCDAVVINCMISEGCHIYGRVENSVLSNGVTVGKGAVVRNSIIMADTKIGDNAGIFMSIIDEEVQVGNNVIIGDPDNYGYAKIAVVGRNAVIEDGVSIEPGAEVAAKATVKNPENAAPEEVLV